MSLTVGSSAAIQGALQQLKVQQARQNADQAEVTARALAAKAGDARRVAARAQENARVLTVQADQANSVAGQARQGLSMLSSVSTMQSQLFNTVERVGERIAAEEPQAASPEASQPASQPVMNTSGQLTGVVVNTVA